MAENFLTPEQILNKLNLEKSMVAADFGCGSGGWTIPLAKMLPEGKVYALDLLETTLSALESKARMEGILNIQIIVADVEKQTPISPNSCDAVLMTNFLFESDDKEKAFGEAIRVLKQGGRILVVDWKKSASFGPRERAVSPEDIKNIALGLGLSVKEEFDAGPYHFGMVLTK